MHENSNIKVSYGYNVIMELPCLQFDTNMVSCELKNTSPNFGSYIENGFGGDIVHVSLKKNIYVDNTLVMNWVTRNAKDTFIERVRN